MHMIFYPMTRNAPILTNSATRTNKVKAKAKDSAGRALEAGSADSVGSVETALHSSKCSTGLANDQDKWWVKILAEQRPFHSWMQRTAPRKTCSSLTSRNVAPVSALGSRRALPRKHALDVADPDRYSSPHPENI